MNPALLAAAGIIVAALLGLFGVLISQLFGRVSKLESDLKAEQDHAEKLWAWGRKLLDLYYRHRGAGAPDPDPIPERD